MPCYYPLKAWKGSERTPSGKCKVVFDASKAIAKSVSFPLPCGKCMGCRIEYSRQWAVRMMHEAQMHEDNCFLTLTYRDEDLPSDGSLNYDHFQLFMKRFRKRFGKVRYFHCGEYGEKLSRPHYHAAFFGFDFPDKVLYSEIDGMRLYTSESLDDVWQKGECKIGALTFESAAYIARYVMKKINGDMADDHYWRLDERTGELYPVEPEYATMSRRPGIGLTWFERFGNEVYPSDEVIVNSLPSRPPRYYDVKLSESEPSVFDAIRSKRIKRALSRADDNTDARLRVREKVARARLSQVVRRYESGDD